MDRSWLENALLPFSGTVVRRAPTVTKTDFYLLGLSGGEGSSEKRKRLAALLSLPTNLSANALINAINIAVSEEEYLSAVEKLKTEV